MPVEKRSEARGVRIPSLKAPVASAPPIPAAALVREAPEVKPTPPSRPRKEKQTARPAYRDLRVFAFDPSRGRRIGNYASIRVKYEPLDAGLKGAQLHVIDYDASNRIFYDAVDLNAPAVMLSGGLEPSEGDPRFHQQMVYAVSAQTIRVFENALGRDICFKFHDGRLRIYPHAMYEPNAYYTRDLGALLFGYFRASTDDAGTNLPGQTVFTCLSHDIVAHETTHAVVDTLRPSFFDGTNPDVGAFHEAFADIVALFQHFMMEDVVRDTLRSTGGVLYKPQVKAGVDNAVITGELAEDNPLLGLAQQFGEAMGTRRALRSALGRKPEPSAYREATEAHERGALLVAAIFDAFFTSFMQRTRDLVRLGRATSGDSNEIHYDIAQRLAREASKTAGHFLTMCIRALDYCPPLDIWFGDFLRALITADTELYQSDAHDYRQALIDAFRVRGIYPDGVESFAEESLLWRPIDEPLTGCAKLNFNLIDPLQHDTANRQELERFVRLHPGCFGICNDSSHTQSNCTCVVPENEPLVMSVNTVIRGGEQRPRVEFVAEIVRSDPNDPSFKGGATVVFDSDGTPKLAIYKKLNSAARRASQQEFKGGALSVAPQYGVDIQPVSPFAMAHRGF